MRVLEVLLPVLVMILLGMFCRKMNFLKRSSVDGLKFLTTKIILPVAIFHALGTAAYSGGAVKVVVIMFGMLVVSFGIGFLLKGFVKEPYKKYVPFMVSVYEGGMMAYPLFTNLCGAENLSQIALLDIAGLLFGFSIYMSLLSQVEGGERISVKQLWVDSIRNPSFIATVLGLLAGITGLLNLLISSPVGEAYLATKDMITTPLSAIILIIVGYEMEPNVRLLKPCFQTISLRFLLQACMIAGVLFCVHRWIGTNQVRDIAIIIYMSAPATFSMQTFLKSEEGSSYVSTANSLYCFVSIAVYAVVAAIM